MKRKILGMAIVALAISLSAFETRPDHSKFLNLFWFPLAAGSGFAYSTPTLVYQTYDPAGCTVWGAGTYCEAGYTSFSGTGPYWPAGLVFRIDYDIYP